MEKLSYEKWRQVYTVKIDHQMIEDLSNFHDIDADEEIEKIMKQEYQWYLDN